MTEYKHSDAIDYFNGAVSASVWADISKYFINRNKHTQTNKNIEGNCSHIHK